MRIEDLMVQTVTTKVATKTRIAAVEGAAEVAVEVIIITAVDEEVVPVEAEVVIIGEEEVVGREATSLSTMWAPVVAATTGKEGSLIMTTTCRTAMGIMLCFQLLQTDLGGCRMASECKAALHARGYGTKGSWSRQGRLMIPCTLIALASTFIYEQDIWMNVYVILCIMFLLSVHLSRHDDRCCQNIIVEPYIQRYFGPEPLEMQPQRSNMHCTSGLREGYISSFPTVMDPNAR